MSFRNVTLSALMLAAAIAAPGMASAQTFDEQELAAQRRNFESPERFAFELRIGTYTPDVGTNAFNIFDGDVGPMLGAEIDVQIVRIPYVGLLGVGASFGWINYSANALSATGAAVTEDTTLTLIPLSLLAVLRIDVLARELGIPFIFTGKLGGDGILWDTNTGTQNDANNISYGVHWAAQAAFELDFLNPSSARALDEEWGINHTFLFFEFYGTTADTTLKLSPDGGFAWAAGIGATL